MAKNCCTICKTENKRDKPIRLIPTVSPFSGCLFPTAAYGTATSHRQINIESYAHQKAANKPANAHSPRQPENISNSFRLPLPVGCAASLRTRFASQSSPTRIADKILAIKDFNEDGYLDIIAASPAPMASAYTSGTIYVYDPKLEKFSESGGIIQQGSINITRLGCISVEYPYSTRPDTEIITDFYCWKNGKWKPVNLKQP